MEQDEYIQCLKEIKEVLDKNKIPFWLTYGTLLGFVQQGKIFSWDDDIDIGIWGESIKEEHIKRKLTRDFEKIGFSLYFFWNAMFIDRKKLSIGVTLYNIDKKKKEIVVDRYRKNNALAFFLFKMFRLSRSRYYGKFKFNMKDGIRDALKINMLKLAHNLPKKYKKYIYKVPFLILSPFQKTTLYNLKFPEKYFHKFKEIDFYGMKVKIPLLAEKYLEKNYGREWKIPLKNPVWWEHGEWKKVK